MQNILNKIFKKNKNIIIGAVHFPPLLGYLGFPGFKVALNNALKDLKAFEKGGVDGVIIENNYDIPHKIVVEPHTIAAITFLGSKIKEKTRLPIGVSVLWNDFQVALAIAKTIGGQFIRIPVFIDKIKTNYGTIKGNPAEVLAYQKKIKGERIALFTDIWVKHGKILEKGPIEESAREAVKAGSDALIVTGRWTGQAPELEKLKKVKEAIGNSPILVGSGANKKNIKKLLEYADGVIVSTSLKRGKTKRGEINVKGWKQRIDVNKVKRLIAALNY